MSKFKVEKYTEEQIKKFKKKADKWDALDKEISNFYSEDDNDNFDGDLSDIGEVTAIAFGYL